MSKRADALEAAQDALHKYGRHHDNCKTLSYRVKRHRYCTCGFIAARHAADPDYLPFKDCKQCVEQPQKEGE